MLSMVKTEQPKAAYGAAFAVARRADEHEHEPDAEVEPRHAHLRAHTSGSYIDHEHDDMSDTATGDEDGAYSGADMHPGGALSAAQMPLRKTRSTKSKCPPGLRSGKWTAEEEAYTNMIIHYFKRGLLHIDDGTSLRWYLAKRLNCEAMRVTKKLKGNSSVGKQVFRARENTPENRRAIAMAAAELEFMEKAFLDSVLSNGAGAHATLGAAMAAGRLKQFAAREATRARSQSEDARLLLHFFTEASDGAEGDGDGDDATTAESSVTVERKRLFSDLEARDQRGGETPSDSPSKRRPHVELQQ